jgi:tRNA-2-methylthio-N6-dimethylallyladenosine synthase
MGTTFFEKEPQVRLVAGSDGIGAAPAAIERLLDAPALRLSLLDFTESYVEREPGAPGPTQPVAYVNIMQGCDNFCTYCIVPYTRGRQKSRSSAAILDECRAALENGAREITLLGQNVNAFGRDSRGDGVSFARLLALVAALPGLERLRYVTPHPKDMGPEDVEAFAALPPLCPRLHLPQQAGSDVVLKRMHRRYDRAAYLDLAARLRAARPDLALSTDLIVGFPGETEADFAATLEMVRACGFMSSFSFCYSDRPGARAALLPDKIPVAVARDRLLRLQALQDELGARWLQSRVGATTTLLLEGPSPREGDAAAPSWQGRDPYGAPVHVPLPVGADYCGKMARVVIVAAKKHSLVARLQGDVW